MMTSDVDLSPPREAFVWIWLPGRTEPVVAGRIQPDGERYIFNYGRS
jgi:serine/threonine-protein kinase HipA